MKILFFGDINGKSGRNAITKILPELRSKHSPDLVIANAENVAHGKGVTLSTINALFNAGVDFCTSGNHVFSKPEGAVVFSQFPDKIIRPANVPKNLPGQGFAIIEARGQKILMINLLGRVFMKEQFDFGEIGNPFMALDEILTSVGKEANIKILDFHAEATSEKRGMGLYADGRLSAVLGSHTHVQTGDAQILPGGTGYLTDLGMTGAAQSVIGVKTEGAIMRLKTEGEEKVPLEIDEGSLFEIGYAVMEIDERTGKCQNIKAELRIEKTANETHSPA